MKRFLGGWLCASVFTALTLGACSNEEEIPAVANNQLQVEANLLSETKAVKTAWLNTDQIGLFAMQSASLSSGYYGEVTAPVIASYAATSSSWSLSPAVSLSSTPAYIYGYYPYSSTVSSGTSIPVTVDSQTDYLYSGSAQVASSSNPKVGLTMKHAMCVLSFNIKKSGYIGTGQLTSVKMQNKSGGTIWKSKGNLNCSTGTITGTETLAYTLSCSKVIEDAGWGTSSPYLLAIPFSTGTSGDVEAVFTVDGKEYTVALPNNQTFSAASKYQLNLTINSGSMELDKTGMLIQSWGADQSVDLGNVSAQ